jgi:hypothetical protein
MSLHKSVSGEFADLCDIILLGSPPVGRAPDAAHHIACISVFLKQPTLRYSKPSDGQSDLHHARRRSSRDSASVTVTSVNFHSGAHTPYTNDLTPPGVPGFMPTRPRYTRSSHSAPRIRYTNTTRATANPITDGIAEIPKIAIMIGTHSQTAAIAAPAIIDALAKPMRRSIGDVVVSAMIGSASCS